MPLIAFFIFRLFLFATDYTELVSNYDYVQITVGYILKLMCAMIAVNVSECQIHSDMFLTKAVSSFVLFFSSSCVASAISVLPVTGWSRGGQNGIRFNFTEKEVRERKKKKNLIETFSQ